MNLRFSNRLLEQYVTYIDLEKNKCYKVYVPYPYFNFSMFTNPAIIIIYIIYKPIITDNV